MAKADFPHANIGGCAWLWSKESIGSYINSCGEGMKSIL